MGPPRRMDRASSLANGQAFSLLTVVRSCWEPDMSLYRTFPIATVFFSIDVAGALTLGLQAW